MKEAKEAKVKANNKQLKNRVRNRQLKNKAKSKVILGTGYPQAISERLITLSMFLSGASLLLSSAHIDVLSEWLRSLAVFCNMDVNAAFHTHAFLLVLDPPKHLEFGIDCNCW